ncbi:nucleoid-associated protein [Bisgaardia hudsonensis]|uniref:Nucleoid-associated protein EV697_104192 n=1 Tax=Bisgaardia hudsonensis TaxID=109472 RepID=A0A4R2MXH3_9PAST|nr:nucleoid-associated protein YejK [Bisgaardia hudsonensis]QLB12330.1 nucleoid-associated protein YejK [Bisgaardia hudsonensis]TCP12377.1 nucleoid-associated protein [Bisgaardia hudsonensis]
MGITVNQIVLHQLILENNDDENIKLATQLRKELLTITPEVEQMMLQLHQSYQNKMKAYGVFQENSIFAQHLNRLLEKESDFLSFSHQSANLLASELGKYSFADNGTLILCQYNFLATDYLFIALLDSKRSMLVDDNLEIQQTNYLEINQFDIASRINLTDLQVDAISNRYLTFIKGRVGRKISDFFMDFLGAEEGLNPKLQNQCLMQAVSDYCEQGDLNKEQSLSVKKQVFEYCKGQISLGEEIEIKELSEHIPTLKEQPFADFTVEQDYGLVESIPPVPATLKSLAKFSGSGKGVTISFDVELLNQRIIWNEEEDSLTIKGLPPNLRDQLQRQLKDQN